MTFGAIGGVFTLGLITLGSAVLLGLDSIRFGCRDCLCRMAVDIRSKTAASCRNAKCWFSPMCGSGPG